MPVMLTAVRGRGVGGRCHPQTVPDFGTVPFNR